MTQCVASFVLFAPGDALAQQAFEKKGANPNVRPRFLAQHRLRFSVWVLRRLHVQF